MLSLYARRLYLDASLTCRGIDGYAYVMFETLECSFDFILCLIFTTTSAIWRNPSFHTVLNNFQAAGLTIKGSLINISTHSVHLNLSSQQHSSPIKSP